jgi:hypothetical protein
MIHPALLNNSFTSHLSGPPTLAEILPSPLHSSRLLSYFSPSISFCLRGRPNIPFAPVVPDSSKSDLSLSRIIPCPSFSSFSLPLPFFIKVPVYFSLLASSLLPSAHPLRTHLYLLLYLLSVSKEKAGVRE